MITCQFEDGGKAELRHVTMDVVVVKDGKVIMEKRTKGLLESGKWGITGGYMARDEDIFGTVEREVFEETGWRVENITLLRIKHWPDRPSEDRQNVSFVFCADAARHEGEKDWESDEVKWFPLEDLPNQIAFDQADDIEVYKRYKKGEITVPMLHKL